MGYLVLIRHGQSKWNLQNRFTGWVDVPLSEAGLKEAELASYKLKNIKFDIAFTSKLVRAQQTLLTILAKQEFTGIFLHESKKRNRWSQHTKNDSKETLIYSSDVLNERFYGALQGLDKDEARKEFGEEQVFIWRRSFDIRPPKGESLKDVCKRVIPYFKRQILPELKKGKNVIISAHGNSLRAMIKHIEQISDKDIPHLELETGKPIIYSFFPSTGNLIKENHFHAYTRPIRWKEPVNLEKELDALSKNNNTVTNINAYASKTAKASNKKSPATKKSKKSQTRNQKTTTQTNTTKKKVKSALKKKPAEYKAKTNKKPSKHNKKVTKQTTTKKAITKKK